MIARVCSDFVISDRIEHFFAKLRFGILPAYTSAAGILSVLVMQRALVGYHEVMILSLWDSKEAAMDFDGCGLACAASLKELGVLQKEVLHFDLVTTWSSEQSP
jgi:hypothetical protein